MEKKITFIDLFAGIGGFRLGLEHIGAECIFSAEIDEHAISMYQANFGDNPKCDITTLKSKDIPDFDILCAGFPCQSFSICGKQDGFRDKVRGTLFFDIYRILEEKKPKVFILENVQNLEKHDKGNTLFIIINALNELGYSVKYKILNAKDFGVPQNRERIILIGNRQGKVFDFDRLKTNTITSMYDFLDKNGEFEYLDKHEYTLLDNNQVKKQKSGLVFCGYRNKKIRSIGVRNGTEYLSRVHKQPNRIYSTIGIHPTIASQEQSGRYYIYVDNKVRKLTINECYRFMGFPNNFIKIGRKSKLYERIGNSICVPMVKSIAEEILYQFWGKQKDNNMNVNKFLEDLYKESIKINSINELELTDKQKHNVLSIVKKEETLKGVYTVLVTSLVYKCLHKEQDVRLHQANMSNGYSGRSFDTKYITPFMKEKGFLAAMKESGWLTRSLEQNVPYNKEYKGKINDKNVKNAFLDILNDIEEHNGSPLEYIKALFSESIRNKKTKSVMLVSPIERESKMSIIEIVEFLNKYFFYRYKSRGASLLPVIALYSIYECIVKELKRFKDKILQPLFSHYSSDKSSGNTGDIVVLNDDRTIYEVVEVKFEIAPTEIMLYDAYKKFANTSIQRYYILSTLMPTDTESKKIYSLTEKIKNEHGCQVITNGIIPTIKYYLRLIENTDLFMERYLYNIQYNDEINMEHKLVWNNIIYEYNKK